MDLTRPTQVGTYRWHGLTQFRLRWAAIAVLLGLAVLEPVTGRLGLPNWALVLGFAAYTLLSEVLARHGELVTPRRQVSADLVVALTIYALGSDPGGPLFALLLLTMIGATARLGLRDSLVYTALTIAATAVIGPLLPLWPEDPHRIRGFATQLLILALVGGGITLLTRRLVWEQERVRAVRDEAARLAELERLRVDFIATVSHDLRTPFTALRAGLGMVEASLDDRLRLDERQLLGNVRRNADRLDMLINDLLTFNQYEAGVLQIDRAALDLRAVVTEAIATIYPLLGEKEQTLEVDLPAPLPVDGDGRRLEQVLVNLLDNAHRHTPAGTCIAVTGATTPEEVRLTVQDNGPGVHPAERDAIFTRFHRLAPTGSGSGLGLTIARAIIEIHGGRLWVESTPGAGATFHVALPRCRNGEAECR